MAIEPSVSEEGNGFIFGRQSDYTVPMTIALKPFFIGKLEIPFPVVLASLAGYTDLPYRLLCRKAGFPFCSTEMMLDKCLLVGGKLLNRLAVLTEEDHPVAGQLIGNDPETMAAAAKKLEDVGFDVVDLNFACPVNKAMKRRRGGYLMSDPDKVLEVTRAVLAATSLPVTLKLRQKYAAQDGHENFWKIAEGGFDAGVSAITAHGRSVEAKYTGPADWDFLAEVKRRFPDRTILGSGDILTPQKALDALEQTGVDGVTAARGALGNPWFFRQTRDLAEGREPYQPSLAEQREAILEHFEGACRLYGPLRGPKIMRKLGIKYARLHPHPRQVRIAFVAVKTPKDWKTVMDTYYS